MDMAVKRKLTISQIVELRGDGKTRKPLREIGNLAGITASRVQQLCDGAETKTSWASGNLSALSIGSYKAIQKALKIKGIKIKAPMLIDLKNFVEEDKNWEELLFWTGGHKKLEEIKAFMRTQGIAPQ
jgi:hypothetical protein